MMIAGWTRIAIEARIVPRGVGNHGDVIRFPTGNWAFEFTLVANRWLPLFPGLAQR
jgi:hypothetical protein